MRNFFKSCAFLLPVIFIMFMLSTGCETEKVVTETVTVHDTVTVTITVHDTITILVNGVEVDTVVANPAMIAQGGTVELTASATAQPGVGPLTFNWFASAGELDAQTGDTVHWKAPDDPQVVTITVHAANAAGTFIGIGASMVGVEMYVPTVTPYYLGDAACAGCHSGNHTEWAGTAHAHAWETLQNSGHPQPFCNPCHAVGWDFDLTDSTFVGNTGNSGYDEAPIAKFEDVQCENCHGPASDHVAQVNPALVQVSYDVMNCGQCHEGTHHPFLTEWRQSPHNFDPYAEDSPSCGGCHDGVAAAIRLSNGSSAYPLNVFYGTGAISERPDTSVVPLQAVVCQACHDPHSPDNPAQVRTVADVPLRTPTGQPPIVVAEGGTGKLCMHCHHARRGPWEHIPNGNVRFGPHHSPQADAMAAETGYKGVADPTFNWAGPSHLLVQNSCKTCHLNMSEFGTGPGGAAVVGHEFIPKPEACVNCHGSITAFTQIPAAADFDGDGTVEGLQEEVDGLMVLLRDAIVNTPPGLDTTTKGFVGAIGDTALSTLEQREAGWNWVYVYEDGSKGIHNPDYIVQLLQTSYSYITSQPVAGAVAVRNDNEAVKNW